jgi:prepilin signal peptidase PulO-like enzyme (type II secretory pathway)
MESFLSAMAELQHEQPIFIFAYLFCVGACIGSFISFISYRYSKYEELEMAIFIAEVNKSTPPKNTHANLFSSRSSCDNCHKKISLYDNIPIISWLILRGRSRCCQAPIDKRYFFSELWIALGFSVPTVFLKIDVGYVMFISIFILSFIAGDIDRRTKTIPFGIIISMALIYAYLLNMKNPFFVENYLMVLLLGLSTTLLNSISSFSNKYIGNADLHYFALGLAIFSNNYLYFAIFLTLCSIIFIVSTLRVTDKDKAMGFSLHFSICAVLLLQLNNSSLFYTTI